MDHCVLLTPKTQTFFWPLDCSLLIPVSVFALTVLTWNTFFLDTSIRFLLNVIPPQKGLPSLLFFFSFFIAFTTT